MAKLVENLEQLHALQIEALREVQRVCAVSGVRWFLHGGTLLGGIREGGPLAWDDDVDIAMLRADYERFRRLAAPKMSERFRLVEPRESDVFFDFIPRITDLAYAYPNTRDDAASFDGRLDHPDIDIFVLEPACERPGRDALQSFRLKLNYAAALGHRPHVDHSQFQGAVKMASYVLSALGARRSMRSLIAERAKIASWGDSATKLLIVNEQPRYWHLRWERAWFDGKRTCPFGGEQLPVPCNAEAVLVNVYGDTWRTPPAASERVPQHANLR